jgi:hypothetical protein
MTCAVLVETIRGAVLWVIWIERNKLCFNNTMCRNIKALGLQIISLTAFRYSNTSTSNLLKLLLVLPHTTDDLFIQVPAQALEVETGVEALENNPLVGD